VRDLPNAAIRPQTRTRATRRACLRTQFLAAKVGHRFAVLLSLKRTNVEKQIPNSFLGAPGRLPDRNVS